jgi:DUF218 domain
MRAAQSELQTASDPDALTFLVTGGSEIVNGEVYSRAEECRRMLVSRYGLPPRQVVSIGGRGSTIGNASATFEYLSAHRDELGDVTKIEIITNDYHMLRSWILFSRGMLEVTKRFGVTEQDKTRVALILDQSLIERPSAPERVRETRERVMSILRPYFEESRVWVTPIVVEEALERDGATVGDVAKIRYARQLRNHKAVQSSIPFEYSGIKKILAEDYNPSA